MIYGLQATLTFPTSARRDSFVSAVETRIAPKPRWGETTVSPNDGGGTFNCVVEIRFASQADLDDAYSFLQQRGVQQQGRGRIARHNRTHNEASRQPCAIAAEVVL